jgi:hypothetical protein
MGKGGRKGGTEERQLDRIDRADKDKHRSNREFWAYLETVEDLAKRHKFSWTEREAQQAWLDGICVEDYILKKCGRR